MDFETVALSISIFSLGFLSGMMGVALCHLRKLSNQSSNEDFSDTDSETEQTEKSSWEDLSDSVSESLTTDSETQSETDSETQSEPDSQSLTTPETIISAIASSDQDKTAEALLTISMNLKQLFEKSDIVPASKKEQLLNILNVASDVVSKTIEEEPIVSFDRLNGVEDTD